MTASTLVVRTAGPDDTRAVGRALAELIERGDVIALSGDLGAGKTCLVQGLAAGLGITARVTSPTFTLVKLYDARVPLCHVDVYRLDTLQDVHGLGDEVMSPDRVTCIEWGDAVVAILPEDRLDIVIDLDTDEVDPEVEPDRLVGLRMRGTWAARRDELCGVLTDHLGEDVSC